MGPFKIFEQRTGDGQLWEWTGVDAAGHSRTYQTIEPAGIASEAGMLEHLRAGFGALTITSLRRCHAREAKQSTGAVSRHAYQTGAWDAAMRELGHLPAERRLGLLEQFRRDSLARAAGVSPDQLNPRRAGLARRGPSLIQRSAT